MSIIHLPSSTFQCELVAETSICPSLRRPKREQQRFLFRKISHLSCRRDRQFMRPRLPATPASSLHAVCICNAAAKAYLPPEIRGDRSSKLCFHRERIFILFSFHLQLSSLLSLVAFACAFFIRTLRHRAAPSSLTAAKRLLPLRAGRAWDDRRPDKTLTLHETTQLKSSPHFFPRRLRARQGLEPFFFQNHSRCCKELNTISQWRPLAQK